MGGFATLTGAGAISGDATATVIDLSLISGVDTIALNGFDVADLSSHDFLF